MNKTLILFCCIFAFTACSRNKSRISGTIENAGNQTLYLEEVGVYNTTTVDSIKLNKNGHFRFLFSNSMPSFYQLRISGDKIIVLFPKPGEKIKVTADAGNITTSLAVDGSHDTEQITKLIKMLYGTRKQLDSIAVLYDKAPDDSARHLLNKEYNRILETHRKSSIAYVLTNTNSLSSVYALYQQYQPGFYVFYKTSDLQFFKILSDSLTKYQPKSPHVEALKAYADKQLANYNTQKLLSTVKTNSVSLPLLKLPQMSGDSIALQSLKGKVVLLNFWISGNQLCIRQNLELKKLYQQYKNRGFEIYGVSFDQSADAWQRAIRFDDLPWINVIDNSPNSVTAGNYNVSQLPANYLINKDNNTVVGKNLTARQVQDKLDELLK